MVFAVSGYRGVEKFQETQDKNANVDWEITFIPGKRKAVEKTKISIRANVSICYSFKIVVLALKNALLGT